jgi:hypothetical protein
MKRSIALLAALPLCLFAAKANAQGIGLKGGVVFNNVKDNGALPGSLERRTGFTAGVTLSTLRGPIGVGIEGMYAQRGVNSPSGTDARRLDYIDVPAYLRVMIPTGSVNPYLLAGPQVSFELNCTADGGDCPSGRSKTTYAGIIGAGIFFGNRGGLSLEGRYMYGLSNLHLSTATSSTSYKHRSFLILAGMQF